MRRAKLAIQVAHQAKEEENALLIGVARGHISSVINSELEAVRG